MDKFNGKKIAILGFGLEGISICDFLPQNCQITVFDEKKEADFNPDVLNKYKGKGVNFELGGFRNLSGFDIVFRSPGIKPDTEVLKEAKDAGIEVTSAIKTFFDMCPCPIVGVTGTKGKGTTSALAYEILKKEGFDAYLGGNIGTPPLNFLDKLNKDSKVVLELSSFQLMDLEKSPHVAVMLMTTSEHLDYHKDVYEYIEAKRNILRFQTAQDFTVLNKDYPASRESDIHTEGTVYMVSREQEVMQGAYVRDGKMILKMDEREEDVFDFKDLALRGKHNWENALAATVASICAGATMKSIITILKSFKGLEHRIEHVATVRGVSYFDDSFSTTPETAIAAIEAFEEPKILILGGSSKNSDFSELGRIISETDSIKAIIGIGVEWARIREKLRIENGELRIKVYEDCKNMGEVVQKCAEIGEIGDVVLLSPACASFDMFKSYKHRGEQFKGEVQSLVN